VIIITILYAWNWNIVNTYITLSAPLTTPHAHVKKPYLGCVWILYLKVISRIFMHKMYYAKNLKCLVGILENAKCILGRIYFANSHF
jgi:hypothetical protein